MANNEPCKHRVIVITQHSVQGGKDIPFYIITRVIYCYVTQFCHTTPNNRLNGQHIMCHMTFNKAPFISSKLHLPNLECSSRQSLLHPKGKEHYRCLPPSHVQIRWYACSSTMPIFSHFCYIFIQFFRLQAWRWEGKGGYGIWSTFMSLVVWISWNILLIHFFV